MDSVVRLVLVLVAMVAPVFSDQHSLYYIYSALNKDVSLPGIYEFTALGLLDDREIDYYNSKEQKKIPKQSWMMEKMQEDYWDKGTLSRKSKEQWFKVNVDILMKRMNHNNTDLHVLQWRHGCEIEESNGQVKFLRGIDEYSYDGSEFLSFDDENMRWIAPVQAAEITKRKWDGVAILNQYTKGYLEKECVDWLTKFMEYGKESLRKHSKPEVYAFEKKSVTDPGKLTLTCLATGFYPKDVKLCLRKFGTSIPEHLLTSSGIRPNDDGTYQLRKSVEIHEDDKAKYDCYVSHISLPEPVIKPWVPRNSLSADMGIYIGGGIAALVGLGLIVAAVVLVVKKKREICAVSCTEVVSRCLAKMKGYNTPTGNGQVQHNGNKSPAVNGKVQHIGNGDLKEKVQLQQNGSNKSPAVNGKVEHNGNKSPAVNGKVEHIGNKSPAVNGKVEHNGNKSPAVNGKVQHIDDKSPQGSNSTLNSVSTESDNKDSEEEMLLQENDDKSPQGSNSTLNSVSTESDNKDSEKEKLLQENGNKSPAVNGKVQHIDDKSPQGSNSTLNSVSTESDNKDSEKEKLLQENDAEPGEKDSGRGSKTPPRSSNENSDNSSQSGSSSNGSPRGSAEDVGAENDQQQEEEVALLDDQDD
ncbi:H-2 class I histocompatibility antigen, L-D alpha chain isoform X47 [Astyanax mexicanus]|uniref:H-2 class I histocompatibility antigen, L-D alpha chain isoform X47 n=1 Tax=Astyanax mexicanus TaxID=7994 RepID=UPI0020CAE8F9|nr:H-2 class I histocompatibility antigen, L-D alpha chain isoform X47 [Astyanax mexicanus]